jgi:hypothetical protein
MSDFEIFLGEIEIPVFAICLTGSAMYWSIAAWRSSAVAPLVDRAPRLQWLMAAFVLVNAINLAALLTLASADVRTDPFYIVYYVVLGLTASIPVMLGLRILGLHRTDIVERGNRAASTLEFAALIAGAFAYAGSNIGDGPGYYVVVVGTALAFASLFAVALVHTAVNRTMYRVLVDRERGTAFRFGCLLVACGLVLGRAVAGDWNGFVPMLVDFRNLAWPVIVLLVVDLFLARITHAREPDGSIAADRAIGVIHLAIAAAYVLALGVPK